VTVLSTAKELYKYCTRKYLELPFRQRGSRQKPGFTVDCEELGGRNKYYNMFSGGGKVIPKFT